MGHFIINAGAVSLNISLSIAVYFIAIFHMDAWEVSLNISLSLAGYFMAIFNMESCVVLLLMPG